MYFVSGRKRELVGAAAQRRSTVHIMPQHFSAPSRLLCHFSTLFSTKRLSFLLSGHDTDRAERMLMTESGYHFSAEPMDSIQNSEAPEPRRPPVSGAKRPSFIESSLSKPTSNDPPF
jgi:hypothetical protein